MAYMIWATHVLQSKLQYWIVVFIKEKNFDELYFVKEYMKMESLVIVN